MRPFGDLPIDWHDHDSLESKSFFTMPRGGLTHFLGHDSDTILDEYDSLESKSFFTMPRGGLTPFLLEFFVRHLRRG